MGCAVSLIEADRYANTGFEMERTPDCGLLNGCGCQSIKSRKRESAAPPASIFQPGVFRRENAAFIILNGRQMLTFEV